MASLKMIIQCPDCKKYLELESDRNGRMIYVNNIDNNDFTFEKPEITVSGELEELSDVDDVDRELDNIRVTCNNCNNYIVLEGWEYL